MNYLSFTFAFFVLILLVLYYALPKKARPYILLCGSLFFYGYFALQYMPFLLFTALSSFFAAKCINKVQHQKLLLWSCIIINFVVWFCTKDLQWMFYLAKTLLSKFGISYEVPILNILVPVGISYYTLQAYGYLIDVYRNKTQPEKNFFKYLLFLSYFPTIVQGPISRYDKLMPQLLNDKKFSYDKAKENFLLILIGLVKKMVIADGLSIFVNYYFAQHAEWYGAILYLSAVGYAFQLYFDFSGCVDICRGVSGLFNIDLVANFNRPYLARSIKDFWGRWHISLSSWLKDYVYIPLGGNRKGTGRKYLNLLLTFLVSGIWHGAGMQFILWGALHALYQIIGQATQNIRGKVNTFLSIRENSFSQRFFQTIITFNLVTFAWIFFRSGSIAEAFVYIGNMFVAPNWHILFNGRMYDCGLTAPQFQLIVLQIVGILMLESRTSGQASAVQSISRQHLIVRWLVYWALIFDVILLGAYGSGYSLSGFMYGGF